MPELREVRHKALRLQLAIETLLHDRACLASLRLVRSFSNNRRKRDWKSYLGSRGTSTRRKAALAIANRISHRCDCFEDTDARPLVDPTVPEGVPSYHEGLRQRITFNLSEAAAIGLPHFEDGHVVSYAAPTGSLRFDADDDPIRLSFLEHLSAECARLGITADNVAQEWPPPTRAEFARRFVDATRGICRDTGKDAGHPDVIRDARLASSAPFHRMAPFIFYIDVDKVTSTGKAFHIHGPHSLRLECRFYTQGSLATGLLQSEIKALTAASRRGLAHLIKSHGRRRRFMRDVEGRWWNKIVPSSLHSGDKALSSKMTIASTRSLPTNGSIPATRRRAKKHQQSAKSAVLGVGAKKSTKSTPRRRSVPTDGADKKRQKGATFSRAPTELLSYAQFVAETVGTPKDVHDPASWAILDYLRYSTVRISRSALPELPAVLSSGDPAAMPRRRRTADLPPSTPARRRTWLLDRQGRDLPPCPLSEWSDFEIYFHACIAPSMQASSSTLFDFLTNQDVIVGFGAAAATDIAALAGHVPPMPVRTVPPDELLDAIRDWTRRVDDKEVTQEAAGDAFGSSAFAFRSQRDEVYKSRSLVCARKAICALPKRSVVQAWARYLCNADAVMRPDGLFAAADGSRPASRPLLPGMPTGIHSRYHTAPTVEVFDAFEEILSELPDYLNLPVRSPIRRNDESVALDEAEGVAVNVAIADGFDEADTAVHSNKAMREEEMSEEVPEEVSDEDDGGNDVGGPRKNRQRAAKDRRTPFPAVTDASGELVLSAFGTTGAALSGAAVLGPWDYLPNRHYHTLSCVSDGWLSPLRKTREWYLEPLRELTGTATAPAARLRELAQQQLAIARLTAELGVTGGEADTTTDRILNRREAYRMVSEAGRAIWLRDSRGRLVTARPWAADCHLDGDPAWLQRTLLLVERFEALRLELVTPSGTPAYTPKTRPTPLARALLEQPEEDGQPRPRIIRSPRRSARPAELAQAIRDRERLVERARGRLTFLETGRVGTPKLSKAELRKAVSATRRTLIRHAQSVWPAVQDLVNSHSLPARWSSLPVSRSRAQSPSSLPLSSASIFRL